MCERAPTPQTRADCSSVVCAGVLGCGMTQCAVVVGLHRIADIRLDSTTSAHGAYAQALVWGAQRAAHIFAVSPGPLIPPDE